MVLQSRAVEALSTIIPTHLLQGRKPGPVKLQLCSSAAFVSAGSSADFKLMSTVLWCRSTHSYKVHQFPWSGPADDTPRSPPGNRPVIVAAYKISHTLSKYLSGGLLTALAPRLSVLVAEVVGSVVEAPVLAEVKARARCEGWCSHDRGHGERS